MTECLTRSPAVPERALFLDVGRKYYTADWLRRMIVFLAENRMNALILHFSEEMGLGIESRRFPWLNGRDGALCVPREVPTDDRQLRQEDVRELAAFAAGCGVELIPSFDSPGHMNALVKRFDERAAEGAFSFESADGGLTEVPRGTTISNFYHYAGKRAVVQGSRNTAYSRGIDISNPIAVSFVRSLLAEYALLFRECGCAKIDLGGDELLGWGASVDESVPKWRQLDHWRDYARSRARKEGKPSAFADSLTAYDGFLYYMNDLCALVRGMGYSSVRMWNDEACRTSDTGWTDDPEKHVALDPAFEIEYWTENAGAPPSKYLEEGRTLYNCINAYSYYVLGKAVPYERCNARDIAAEWDPFRFASGRVGFSSKIGGSAFCVWSDDPAVDEETVWEEVLPLLRVHAAKARGETVE